MMIGCYDLTCNPPTYDVVAFLALLEAERLRRGENSVELYIRPGPAGGFRRDNLWPRSVEERIRLRDNVLFPLCYMLPSVSSVRWGETPAGAAGIGQRWISLPNIVKALKLGSRPLRAPVSVTEPEIEVRPKRITFTLRESEHHPLRNSRTEEWVKAAGELAKLGFGVVVLRDTAVARESLRGVVTSTLGPVQIARRAYLYASSRLNVGISNGPMWMSIFMDAPTLMLRPTTNAAAGCYDDRFFEKYGVPPGSQLPNSPPHQRLVWEEDYAPNIVRAVEDMLCAAG